MPHSQTEGFSSPEICKLCHISYRQLDHWCRLFMLVPEIRTASGSGSQRRFSVNDVKKILFARLLINNGWRVDRVADLIASVDFRIVEDGQLFAVGIETRTLQSFDPSIFTPTFREPMLFFRLEFPDEIKPNQKETL